MFTVFTVHDQVLIFMFLFQALYNLGFIIENNFSVDGIHFSNLKKFGKARGNLLLAKNFYER